MDEQPAIQSMSTMKRTMRIIGWLAVGWTGLFLVLFVPIGLLHKARTESRSVVTATVDNHVLKRFEGRYGPDYRVFATLTFDRIQDGKVINCVLQDQQMGGNESRSFAKTLEIAVPPYSCYEWVRLPLPDYGEALLLMYLMILGSVSFGVFLVFGVFGMAGNDGATPTSYFSPRVGD